MEEKLTSPKKIEAPEALAQLNKMKRLIVNVAAQAGEGHIPSAFSVLDLLWVLYDRVLKIDPLHPLASDRDRFILSKGHASLALYAVLAEKGFFPAAEIQSFGKFNSAFGGHADRNKVPGVEASTGSLGHGFPMAVGIALGLKIQKNPAKVFCLIGDGEANEGSIWEAAMLAAHHQLSNLCCIVDYNHSTDRALMMGDITKKFKAFGWQAQSIQGHNHEEIFNSLSLSAVGAPLMLVAETIKGHGVKKMEGNPSWHHKAPQKEDLAEILGELS